MGEVTRATPMKAVDDVDLTPGTVVGEYRIERRLTAGGMGTVYAATHPIIGKRAAIKVLKAQHSRDALLIQRFVDEARAVNHIGHDHIVDIFAFGTLADGRSYFVMEWLEGLSLKQALRRQHIPFLEAVRILDELCDALHAAHVKGIVHRDLKPDNVFLEDVRGSSSVKLLDFGIAKLGGTIQRTDASDVEATSPDVVMGTPDYISPEQATARETTASADVYSLGVIAFEMFTGERPFHGEGPMEVLVKHVSQPAPAARSIRPEVPPSLERLLAAMLAKEPTERPSTVEVQQTLRDMARVARASMGMPGPRARGLQRPVLLRTGDRLGDLARPLLSELSAGACWVDAAGSAPPVGTPVTLRFEVPHLDAQLDFDGVISGVFGEAGERVLIRYDRIPKRTIDHVVELGSDVARSGGRLGAVWREDLETEPSPWVGFLAAEGAIEARTDDAEPTAASMPVSRATGPISRASRVATTTDAPKRPPRLTWFGLGARMLAITLLIAAGAVASVTYVALRQARVDREFYVQDQNLTTARALAETIDQQATVWRKQLELTLAKGVYRGPTDEFTALASCTAGTCTPVFGDLPDERRIDRLRRESEEGRLTVDAASGGLWVATGTPDSWALARVSASRLERLADVAPNVDLAVLGPDARVVTTRGPGRVQALARQPFLAEIAAAERPYGARRYASGPSDLLAAWSRTRDLTLVVASPLAVTVQQTRVLTRQVTWVAVLVFAVAVVLALLLSSTTTSRLRKLAGQARRVALGDFSEMPTVAGGDEVSELSRYFRDMTQALRQRDEEVLAAQRAMSADEARAVQDSLSEWLQQDLASRLEDIRRTIEATRATDDETLALKQQLEQLSAQASNSLQSALLFASTSRQRIDLASAVRDSVANLERHRDDVRVAFSAPNAVLFPWLEADDSRLRETVLLIVRRAIEAAGTSVDVRLAMEDRERVLLTVAFDGELRAAEDIARRVRPLAREQHATVQVGESSDGRPAIGVAYRARPETVA
jgi:serine/threonine-protein kinase